MNDNSCSARKDWKFENRNLRSMTIVLSIIFAQKPQEMTRGLNTRYTPSMSPDRREVPDEPPPFLGAWRRVYTAVVLYLALLIAVCYAFTRAFS